MTDLRTAAQAVIDTWDEYGVTACIVHIEALRQALDAPVEPVAWQYRVVFRLTGEDSFRHGRWHECRDKAEYDDYKSRHWFEVRELYTTPPSEPVEPVGYVISDPDGFVPVGYTKPPSEPVEPVACGLKHNSVWKKGANDRPYQVSNFSCDVCGYVGLDDGMPTCRKSTPPSVAVEPVAEIVRNETGQIRLVDSNGDSFDVSKHIGTKLYTTPPSVAVEPVCNPHPDAPHGFNRNASHTEDRYVCDCESWEPPSIDALIAEAVATEREACAQIAMDFWCDAFAEAIRARGQK